MTKAEARALFQACVLEHVEVTRCPTRKHVQRGKMTKHPCSTRSTGGDGRRLRMGYLKDCWADDVRVLTKA